MSTTLTTATNPSLMAAAVMSDPSQLRDACRNGSFATTTGGQCPGFTQANLLILPARFAADFERFCRRNPVSCPLLGLSRNGDRSIPTPLVSAHASSDVCHDLPGYNIYDTNSGKLLASQKSVEELWRSDFSSFFIGCSFSFENALAGAGLTPRHWSTGGQVAMYKTKYKLLPAGVFQGHMVVSMRPYKEKDVQKARNITANFIATHGEPVAWGFDQAKSILGIEDLSKPDFGFPTKILDGEIPVFWGCGVTPQLVAMETFARLAEERKMGISDVVEAIEGEVAIGHMPGHMLVTDLPEQAVSQGQIIC